MKRAALILTASLLLGATGCVRAGFEGSWSTTPDGGAADIHDAGDTGPAADLLTRVNQGGDGGAWTGVTGNVNVGGSSSGGGGGVQLPEQSGFASKKTVLTTPVVWATAAPLGDYIYLFGGAKTTGGSSMTDKAFRYDPRTDSAKEVASLTAPLCMSTSTAGSDGKIYVMKGSSQGNVLEDRIQRYDPALDTFTLLTEKLTGSIRAAAAASGKKIYLFGGYGTGPMRTVIEAYDVTQAKVETLTASLTTVGVRERAVACAGPGGKIFIFGGAKVKHTTPTGGKSITDEILELDPVSAKISVVATMPARLMNVAVGLLPDGKIYIFGGDTPTTEPGVEQTNKVYSFDPKTYLVSALVATLPTPLSGAAAAVSSSGKMYLVGGRHGSEVSKKILEFRPYATTGEAAGPVLDTGVAGSTWLELSWTVVAPAGTKIEMSARASDQAFTASSSLPWQPLGPGPLVSSGLPKGRYLQWRATLSTDSTAFTPVLQQVSLRYLKGS